MHKQRVIYASVVALVVIFGLYGLARSAVGFLGEGTVTFDSIKVGQEGVGGVTFFNGTIVNQTSDSSGKDNPVTFGDNLRIDGRVYRGSSQGPGDDTPFIIDDDLQVTGDMVGIASSSSVSNLEDDISDLWEYNSTSNDVLASMADRISELQDAAIENRHFIIYQHDLLDCVGDRAQYTYNLSSDDYVYCWNHTMAGHTVPPSLSISDAETLSSEINNLLTIPTFSRQ